MIKILFLKSTFDCLASNASNRSFGRLSSLATVSADMHRAAEIVGRRSQTVLGYEVAYMNGPGRQSPERRMGVRDGIRNLGIYIDGTGQLWIEIVRNRTEL